MASSANEGLPAHARWQDREKDTKTRHRLTTIKEKGLIVGGITAKRR